MKNFLLWLLLIIFIHNTVYAYDGFFWYDNTSDILSKQRKIIVYPPINSFHRDVTYKDIVAIQELYDYIKSKRKSKKIIIGKRTSFSEELSGEYFINLLKKNFKKPNFLPLVPFTSEKNTVIDYTQYKDLLGSFELETERAKKIDEATAADAYIISRYRIFEETEYISPSKEFDVTLREYTQEIDSPNGDYIHDEVSENVHYVIPEKKLNYHTAEFECIIYDINANKLAVYVDEPITAYGPYIGTNGVEITNSEKDIQKIFCENLLEATKRIGKVQSGNIKIGFHTIESLDLIKMHSKIENDDNINKACYFLMENEAANTLKNCTIITELNNNSSVDYYVEGKIHSLERTSQWTEPRLGIGRKEIGYETYKWTDDLGKEHTCQIFRYKEYPVDNYGFWKFGWQLRTTFNLVDARTNKTLVSYTGTSNAVRASKAYQNSLKIFYGKVNDYLKN